MPIRHRIRARERNLVSGFSIRRALPHHSCRSVGPFVFLDHFGPIALDRRMDVAPHPHIGLATVTWLYEGVTVHRDSLGSHQRIEPGALNWMSAGRGIVHSERAPADAVPPFRSHGLQLWVALPREHEDGDPSFDHYPANALPIFEEAGARVTAIVGSAGGHTSPVRTLAPTLFASADLSANAAWPVPDAIERAVYVVEGAVQIAGERFEAGELAVVDGAVEVATTAPARVAVIGGDPLDGPRQMSWNFVHSSRERIAAAADDWRNHRFPLVPGDEADRIELP